MLKTRYGGLYIAGITDAVAKYLTAPYDIIVEWCAYIRSEEALSINSISVCGSYAIEIDDETLIRWGNTPFSIETYGCRAAYIVGPWRI